MAFPKPRTNRDADSVTAAERTIAVVGIIATLVGTLAGAIWGAKIAADASLGAVREQILAATAEEDRKKTGEVYSAYLKAVDAYTSTTTYLRYARSVEVIPDPEGSGRMVERLSGDDFDRYERARTAMQGRVNDLFAFGSSEAVDKAIALQATLPTLSGKLLSGADYDANAYTAAYLDFQGLYCDEIARDPTEDCRPDGAPPGLSREPEPSAGTPHQ